MKEKVMILKNFVFITVAEYAFVQFNLSQSVCRRNIIVGDRQTDRQIDTQTDRHTDIHRHRRDSCRELSFHSFGDGGGGMLIRTLSLRNTSKWSDSFSINLH